MYLVSICLLYNSATTINVVMFTWCEYLCKKCGSSSFEKSYLKTVM